MIDISVIVPAYNSSSFISRCLDSVLSDGGDYFEIVVVDDGSSDNTLKIINQYAQTDHRVKAFHKENGGVSSARNVGLENAIGKYVLFLDSDDTLPNDALKEYKKVIDLNDETDLVFCRTLHSNNLNQIKNNQIKSNALLKDEEYKIIISQYLKREGIQYSSLSKLFKSEIIKSNNIRFNEKISFCEDVLFNLNYFSYAKTAYFIDKFLYSVNPSEFSLTTIYKENQLLALLEVRDLSLKLFNSKHLDTVLDCSFADNRFVLEALDLVFRILNNKYKNLSEYHLKKEQSLIILNNKELKNIINKDRHKKGFLTRSIPERIVKMFYRNKNHLCFFMLRLYYSMKGVLKRG